MPQTRNNPSSYQRRVLLISVGGSPAVITETLYGLINLQQAFIPTEIQVVTTEFGRKAIKQQLFPDGQPALIEQLWTHHKARFAGAGPPAFTHKEHVHVIRDLKTDEPLYDITEPSDCDATANLFKQLTFSYIKDPDCALHCSLAGGRKVMSFYSGYLFSLGGRQQDRLSHTLISPSQLEHTRDFYYPLPQQSHSYLERSNDGTADNQVTLASDQISITIVDIPFAPLSNDKQFRDALFDPSKSYSHAIRCAKEAINDPVVAFDLFSIKVNQDTIALNPQSMAYYVLLLIFPEGVSVEHMTAVQAKVMTNIYTSIKGPTNELKFFKKRLQTLESRRKFFKWVKHQTIDRFLEYSSSDPRNIQPLYNRQSKLHMIPIATHIADGNPQLVNKLKAEFIGPGLTQATELYIQQHFK